MMVCTHAYLGVPNSNYVWCTNCGTLKETHTFVQWNPKYLELVGQGEAPLTNEEKQYCNPSQKIMAIKLVHKRTGVGLKEAKDIVEAYMGKHPMPSPKPTTASPICVSCNRDFNSYDVLRVDNSNTCWACYDERNA